MAPAKQTTRISYELKSALLSEELDPGPTNEPASDEDNAVLENRIATGLASMTVPLLPIPLIRYLVQSHFSYRYHCFTDDVQNSNARGVFVRLRKK